MDQYIKEMKEKKKKNTKAESFSVPMEIQKQGRGLYHLER